MRSDCARAAVEPFRLYEMLTTVQESATEAKTVKKKMVKKGNAKKKQKRKRWGKDPTT